VSSEVDEKLIEVVHKCEELCDMSNKKYSDRVWEEKLNITDQPNIALFSSPKAQIQTDY